MWLTHNFHAKKVGLNLFFFKFYLFIYFRSEAKGGPENFCDDFDLHQAPTGVYERSLMSPSSNCKK